MPSFIDSTRYVVVIIGETPEAKWAMKAAVVGNEYIVQGCNDNNNHSRKPIRQQLVLSLTRYHNIKLIHSFVRIECFNTDNKIMELITHFR